MSLTTEQARALLKAHGLRATAPRLAVITLLARQQRPLAHTEVLTALGPTDWDPATVYRNLVKLAEVGLARVVSKAEGMARYELTPRGDTADTRHTHPHFVCTDCGTVSCLPQAAVNQTPGDPAWRAAVARAEVQFRGVCPDCCVSA